MENNIKKLKVFQHTRTFICDLFNLANCVKQALKFISAWCFQQFQTRQENQNFICDVLHDLVPFVQFKKHEKHQWRNFTVSKVLLKVKLLHGCFSCFLNCAKIPNRTTINFIIILFDVLPNFHFTTSKTMCDYYL